MFEAIARDYERQRIDPEARKHQQQRALRSAVALSALVGALCMLSAKQETTTETSGTLWWERETTSVVPTSTRIGWFVAGVVLITFAVALATFLIRQARRREELKQYLVILTGVEVIKIQQISDITGHSPQRVYRNIQTMIGSGMIEDFYVDHQCEQVVSRKYIPKASYKTVVTCSGCGGNNELIVGITKTCSFCGQPLLLGTT